MFLSLDENTYFLNRLSIYRHCFQSLTYAHPRTNSECHVGIVVAFSESVRVVDFRFSPESRIQSKSVQGDKYWRAFLNNDIGIRNLEFHIFFINIKLKAINEQHNFGNRVNFVRNKIADIIYH